MSHVVWQVLRVVRDGQVLVEHREGRGDLFTPVVLDLLASELLGRERLDYTDRRRDECDKWNRSHDFRR